ncbi:hypothetical protein Micbo1qcDRAFT_170504 [Microdochium bolleyi]|uniref:Uncharacterized protein n=1 Tax=Microdochium bolleyi TaxID=196109 RepID=A0A136JHU5_9PEZI|nr:hypothetical protein Micbo1qcDRAFT_170504 [Microdochium bolleyi]
MAVYLPAPLSSLSLFVGDLVPAIRISRARSPSLQAAPPADAPRAAGGRSGSKQSLNFFGLRRGGAQGLFRLFADVRANSIAFSDLDAGSAGARFDELQHERAGAKADELCCRSLQASDKPGWACGVPMSESPRVRRC